MIPFDESETRSIARLRAGAWAAPIRDGTPPTVRAAIRGITFLMSVSDGGRRTWSLSASAKSGMTPKRREAVDEAARLLGTPPTPTFTSGGGVTHWHYRVDELGDVRNHVRMASLKKLIEIADRAYGPDGLVLSYAKDPTGEYGDTLAKFVALELRDIHESAATENDQLESAAGVMASAARQLDDVAMAFDDVFGKKIARTR